MRYPVTGNGLVTLTLLGGLLIGVVSVGLAAPGLVPGLDGSPTVRSPPPTAAAGAPTPAPGFTPVVQQHPGAEEEYEAFAEAWHGRVRVVLTDDDLFTVEPADRDR